MTQALDIEAVNTKAKQIAEETGVFPEMAVVAREFAREAREWEHRAIRAEIVNREQAIRIGWLEQKIASVG
jgi:hypothetical protein